jgi:DNA-binding SARP family transcriptional activator/Flp pilus assembly protein TadD
LRLRTFGGLWIEGAQPAPALGPRRMALLAVIAAAGRRGVSRDRVVGILWPESEEEQARHALSQTLYSLKRETGREWIVAGPVLALDPGITSDVSELGDALATKDYEAASDLYIGPFLEGFYLPGAPEFERWVDDERARLRAEVMRAAERAVAHAERQGNPGDAVRFWTRLTELDPLSAQYAAGRMRAHAAAGDRASALAHAQRHETVVRRELDTNLDPAIRRLTRTLRSEPGEGPAEDHSPLAGVPPSSPLVTHSAENGRPTGTIGSPVPAPAAAHPLATPAARRRQMRPGAVLLVVAVLLALGVTVLRPRSPVAVPFLAVGTIRTPELGDTSGLGPILRDMLATSLGGLEGIQVVANSRLIELTQTARSAERAAATDAARRAGATEMIEGELTTTGSQQVLTLRRVDLSRGVVRRGYAVRATERYALVDSAAATIARDLGLAPPSLAVREVRTSSPEAYLLYNEGLRAYYGFDSPGALRLMNAALERDSTFAMAAYYAWNIGEHFVDRATNQRDLERLKRLATRTIERERLLLQAQVAMREAPIAVSLAIAETLAVRYPLDPDGHILHGQILTERGDFGAAVAAFERAYAIDSTAGATTTPYCRPCRVLGSLTHTYSWWDSAAAAERMGRRAIALRPDDPGQIANVGEALLRQGRRAAALEAVERSGVLNTSASVEIGSTLLRDLIRWSRLDEADRALLVDAESPSLSVRGGARWLLMLSLRDQGRLREARALGLERRLPGSLGRVKGLDPERVLSASMLAPIGRADSAARLLHAEARRVSALESRPGPRARNTVWYLTLAGSAYAAAGDTATVRRVADSIEVIGLGSTYGRDPRIHHYLRGLILQRQGRHTEAVAHFRQAIFSLTDGYSEINLSLARSLQALGRPAEAVAVLRPAIHGGVDGSNTYTSRTELHEEMALAFEQAGSRDSAVAHWRVVESNWRRADPEFAERYRRARARSGL